MDHSWHMDRSYPQWLTILMIWGGLWDLLVVLLLLVKVVIWLNMMMMMSDPFVTLSIMTKRGRCCFEGGDLVLRGSMVYFVCLLIYFHVFKFKTIWFCTYIFSLDYVFSFVTIGIKLSMFHMFLIITLCSIFLYSVVTIFICLYFYKHMRLCICLVFQERLVYSIFKTYILLLVAF